MRRIRIGIDVGGTFTKAVAVETKTGAIIAKAVILTTHNAPTGVADGILESLSEILSSGKIDPDEVELISHSTTQAINALLERDTSKVGIIAMGVGPEKREIINRTSFKDDDINLRTVNAFLDTSYMLTEQKVDAAITELRNKGAKVILAAEAFSVDDPSNEMFVLEGAARAKLPATASHEISGTYGLEIRTMTAAMNASVLPKTAQVAGHVERAVKSLAIKAPLMIMRGDGGVTSMDTFRTRPILTILSGPAASIAGALLHLRVTNGIFVEVGGTSTNICIIHDGKPEIRYVTIRGKPTCARSLDVRVVGSAGGSMVLQHSRGVWMAGTRSAHIAGLKYACYADPEKLCNGKLVTIRPTPNDDNEYVAIKCDDETFAITNTCAANALGIIPKGDYSYSNSESARLAMQMLGSATSTAYSEVARSIIQTSSFEITKEVSRIIKEYKLDSRTKIIGAGGGASVLAPFVAKQLGLEYQKADNAEIISSIGAASSTLQETLEISMAEPDSEKIHAACRKVHAALVSRGAVAESVIVDSQYDPERAVLRVNAVGNVELDSTSSKTRNIFTLDEARIRAAEVMRIPPGLVDLGFESDNYLIFTGRAKRRRVFGTKTQRRTLVLDRFGRAKLSLDDALVLQGGRNSILEELEQIENSRGSPIAARTYLVDDLRLVDYSALTSSVHIVDAIRKEIGDSRAAVIIEV